MDGRTNKTKKTMAIEELNNLGKEFEQAQRAFEQKAQNLLEAAFTEYFAKYPEVEALTWTQYTPYFNDGDSCEFSVGDIRIIKSEDSNERAEDEDDDDEDGECIPWKPESRQPYQSDAADIESFLQRHEEVANAAYGDHSRVTVTRNGADVEEYNHD